MRRTLAGLLSLSIAFTSVTAFAGDKKKAAPHVEPSSSTGGTNPLVYVGFGVMGAGALVGALYGADSIHAANTAKERCVDNRCPPSSFEFIDQSRTSAAISNVAFGVAILGLGVGVYGLIAKPSSSNKEDAPDYHPSPPGISLNVNVGPGSIALSGAF
jgi:hypothetical protein